MKIPGDALSVSDTCICVIKFVFIFTVILLSYEKQAGANKINFLNPEDQESTCRKFTHTKGRSSKIPWYA